MGKYSRYKVDLASLPDGKFEQDFECDTEFFKNMEVADILSADVKVHLDLEKRNDAYDCTFRCKGMVQIPCDRCLDPLDHEVDTEYHVVVKYGEDYNDESDELLVIPESSLSLNVAYILKDTIVLTIPPRHVHPQGKCNRAMMAALNKHTVGTSDDDEDIARAVEETDAELSFGGEEADE